MIRSHLKCKLCQHWKILLNQTETHKEILQCVRFFGYMPLPCWHLVCRKDHGPKLCFEQKGPSPLHPKVSTLSSLWKFTTGPSIISLLRGCWGTPKSLTKEIWAVGNSYSWNHIAFQKHLNVILRCVKNPLVTQGDHSLAQNVSLWRGCYPAFSLNHTLYTPKWCKATMQST